MEKTGAPIFRSKKKIQIEQALIPVAVNAPLDDPDDRLELTWNQSNFSGDQNDIPLHTFICLFCDSCLAFKLQSSATPRYPSEQTHLLFRWV